MRCLLYLLQTKQPKLPQLLLIRRALQTFHKRSCFSLDMLQHLNGHFKVRGPELNTALKAWPHHPWVRGSDLFPSPANHPYNHHFLICTGSFLLVVCRLSLLLGVAYNELPTIPLDTAASSTVACFVNISSIHRSPWPDLNRRYTSDQWGHFSLNTQLQM